MAKRTSMPGDCFLCVVGDSVQVLGPESPSPLVSLTEKDACRRLLAFDDLLAACKALLTVSLPHDVSGERVIANAREVVRKAAELRE